MDLKQQLVIWKKASYLLDNIALSLQFYDRLVEEDIFNSEMISEVQSQRFNVEQKLKMLTLLGTYGTDVFQKFLRVLGDSDHIDLQKELIKTEKYTKFGEMLPPCFTYFLDMSMFLRKYPHIAIRLGEEEKHLVQTFIEGKMEMEARKTAETINTLRKDKEKLKYIIHRQKKEIKARVEKENLLQTKLTKAYERIESLQFKVNELEQVSIEHRNEIRRLRHFRLQQEDLEKFLKDECKRLGVNLSRMQLGDRPLSRIGGEMKMETNDESSAILPAIDSAREDTQTNLIKKQSGIVRTKLLHTQLNLLVNKLFHTQLDWTRLQVEEERLLTFLNDSNHIDKNVIQEIKKSLSEIKKEKKVLAALLEEGDKDILTRETELTELRKKVYGIGTRPNTQTGKEDVLVTKLKILMDQLRRKHGRNMKEMEERHKKEIENLMQHIQDLNTKHFHEVGALRGKIRQKMIEIHKKDTLHKRLRNQINVVVRYYAKNMNATVTIDEARKIVRGIIMEAHRLKDMAEERDLKDDRFKPPDEQPPDEDDEQKKKKNKKKKKKKFNALADDRLSFVAEKIADDWKRMGLLAGLTANRIELVELDHPRLTKEKLAYTMLKIWRDEEKGRVDELFDALEKLGRKDLGMIIMPARRMIVTKDAAKETDPADIELPSTKLPAQVVA